MNQLSLFRNPSNSYKRRPKIPNTNLNDNSQKKLGLKIPELTSNDLKSPQKIELIKPLSNEIDANKPGIKKVQ